MSRRHQSGQAILLFILLIGVACGMLGLAVDGSRLFDEKRRIQSMADAGAIGAAFEFRYTESEQALAEAALDDVRLNGYQDDTDRITVARIEAESGQAAVRVSISRKVRMTLLGMFGARELYVSAAAAATLARASEPCVLALAEDGPDALVVEGSGAIRVDCDVEVRSSDPQALALPGEGCLSAESVRAHSAEDACVSPRPEPATGPRRIAEEVPTPTCEGIADGAATNSADGAVDYWPGCYRDRIVIEEGFVRFAPGRYILLEGMEILGGEVRGQDVSFAVPGGPLRIVDEAWVRLDSGTNERLIDAAASKGSALLMPGGDSILSGGLHLPSREVVWRPNARQSSAWNTVTAHRLRLMVEDDNRAIAAPADIVQFAEARPVLIQ